MTALKHHPTLWLRDDAAAQMNKAEDERGILRISSAGRTEAEQQTLINRWDKGGVANRPPNLYAPARPASASNHVKNGGVAADVIDYNKFNDYCQLYGFVQSFPGSDPVHFDFVGVAGGGAAANKTTKDRQTWLISLGYNLGPSGADGIEGDYTRAAYKQYQTFLRAFGYAGAIDGKWGNGTQNAHQNYYNHLTLPPAAPSTPSGGIAYHTASVADIRSLADTRGMQKVAKKYGYTGKIDNIFGAGSQAGLQQFLNVNYSGSLAKWLRTKWGYVGNDLWGPVMQAAAVKANKANFDQLP